MSYSISIIDRVITAIVARSGSCFSFTIAIYRYFLVTLDLKPSILNLHLLTDIQAQIMSATCLIATRQLLLLFSPNQVD